jgi:flagellar protein FlaJ
VKFQPWTTAYVWLGKRIERFLPEFEELHTNLRKAGIAISFKAYVAFMFMVSIIAFAAAFVLSLFMIPLIAGMSLLSGGNFLISLMLAGLSAVMTLILAYAYPEMKASNRKVPIENNLPYVSSFLTLLSSSNVPPSIIFNSVSRIATLKEVRQEFSNILRDVEIFGQDLMSAIIANAKLTPNHKLRELLIGYVATIRTGGNPTEYLKVQTEAITKERLGKLDMMLESLEAIAEIYIMVLIAMPLLFVVLFATLGMMGGGVMDAGLFLYLLTYAGIPIMGTVMMVLISTLEK